MTFPGTVHCRVEVTGAGSALPRIVSILHARGLTIEHLHLDPTGGCLLVRGSGATRVATVLERLVEVTAVDLTASCRERPALPTTYLVWRQELPAAG